MSDMYQFWDMLEPAVISKQSEVSEVLISNDDAITTYFFQSKRDLLITLG